MKKRNFLLGATLACACLAVGMNSANAEIDPEHIGDTLVGTNHVTYSSTDEGGTSTGHVDITNPDDSTQTIYYTYTKPDNYDISTERVKDESFTQESVTNKLFQNLESSTNGGGAVNLSTNSATIVSDFVNNYIEKTSSNTNVFGGAIYNNATLGNITGDFIANHLRSTNGKSYGGAIRNGGTIGDITGDFVENYAYSKNESFGGAIRNLENSSISNIYGNAIGNYARTPSGSSYGGFIHNDGEIKRIGTVDSLFAKNYTSANKHTKGGVIFNGETGVVNDISGLFINNYNESTTGTARGGAIYNEGEIGKIDADFILNTVLVKSGASAATGGAISNMFSTAKIDSISGKFISNGAKNISSTSGDVFGGAINNYQGTIGSIEGIFNDNTAKGNNSSEAASGAIHNSEGTIGNISASFSKNIAFAESHAKAGAIGNMGSTALIESIIGDMTENHVRTGSGVARGGAVYNEGTIKLIDGKYTGNYVAGGSQDVSGGAISNMFGGTINKINGAFENNRASTYVSTGQSGNAAGGAIHNYQSKIGDITAEFISNDVDCDKSAYGGAIQNKESEIESIIGNFTGNRSTSHNSDAGGGAISNIYNSSEEGTSTIGSIKGNFENNRASADSGNSYGGAIYNSGTNAIISSIEGNFTNNYASSETSGAWGGAIYNYYGTISSIEGDFTNNYASSNSHAYGGAIYNFYGTISSITGDFINNYASSETKSAYGGAIYNAGTNATIGNIEGDFKNNRASSKADSGNSYGGAIYNYGTNATISSITGDFTNNYASGSNSEALGGAIFNSGTNVTISSITGDFTNNYASSETKSAYGGAIYNYYGTINSIEGNFTNNYASSNSHALGGAIRNSYGTIGSIEGNFENNRASSSYGLSYGGAILNDGGKIGSIKGNFENNSASADNGYSYSNGGAIYNDGGKIGSIEGNFENNNASSSDNNAYGGAIRNSGSLSSITGDFINNYASGSSAYGGAIYNHRTIGSIEGNFVGNSASSRDGDSYGGAIYNGEVSSNHPSYNANSKITLSGNTFTDNYVQVGSTQTPNSIYNAGIINIANGATVTVNDGWQSIDDSTGTGQLVMGTDSTFNLNIGNGTIQNDSLGKITNVGTINATVDIDTSDVSNPLSDTITVSSVTQSGKINLTNLNFIGGSIDDFKDHMLTVQILRNTNNSDALQLELAGALAPSGEVKLQTGEKVAHTDDMQVDTKWTDTYESYNLSTDIYGTIGLATTDTTNDSIGVTATRAVETKSDITVMDTLKVVNQSDLATRNFNATVDGETYTATDDLGKAGAGTITINGMPAGGETQGTIDLAGFKGFELDKATTLNVNDVVVKNASAVTGVIDGTSTDAVVNLSNSEIDGNVTNAGEMNLENSQITGIVNNTGVLNLKEGAQLGSAITGAGTTNINNDFTLENPITGNDVTLNNGAELSVGTTGMLSGANSFTVNSGSLNLQNGVASNTNLGNLTLNSNLDLKIDGNFASKQIDTITVNSITANGNHINIANVNVLTPITEESFSISPIGEMADAGVKADLASAIEYTAGDIAMTPIYKYSVAYDKDNAMLQFTRSGGGGGGGEFNPAVVAAPVATQAAAQVTLENTFNYSFSNSDTFMLLPKQERVAIRNRNKYAIAQSELPEGANPLYEMQDNSSAWFKPYASFENVPLKNGPKVNVISYGALAGYDTDLKELKRGWARAWTGFVGYNGASINYSDVTTIQNGGILGGTLTMYKGNFFNATTLSVGATVGDNHTMYGHETTTSLLSGLGNKTGYNFEFKDGKFIVQPNLFLGYTMVKTFDYTNAAGVRIDSNPAHTFQISPGVKFIGNLKHGWQPYIGVNMVWNVLNSSHVSANSVTLPQMSVKPYIQYGVGLQKTIKDNFVAYGQAMIQNGGRNGISLTAGFRWAIGRGVNESKPIEKVQKPKKEIKAANSKIFRSAQVNDEVNADNTRISHKTVIKQLNR